MFNVHSLTPHFDKLTTHQTLQARTPCAESSMYSALVPCLLRQKGSQMASLAAYFRPFLGGIFFNTRPSPTSSRLFRFVMRMLAVGSNCLPAGGIGALAHARSAARLPSESVYTQGGMRCRQQWAVLRP